MSINQGDLFWTKVDVRGPAECWEWQGYRSVIGYGSLSWNGKTYNAHRVAYIVTFGDPGDLDVCHTCDNRPCCNPSHLFKGTAKDNMRDMVVKGRAANIKLVWDDVHGIRDLYRTGLYSTAQIGEMFGVSAKLIWNIVANKKWHDPLYEYQPRVDACAGENNPGARLTWATVREMRDLHRTGCYSQYKLAEIFSISRQAVQLIVTGKTWQEDA